jgi:hypothetical protein
MDIELTDKEQKEQELNKFIDDFILDCKNKFDVVPLVSIQYKVNKNFRCIPLSEIIRIVNNQLYVNNSKYFPLGIRTKGRDKVLVLYRYIYYTIARNLSYTLKEIAESVNKNHASVLHGIRQIKNLLETGINADVTDPYNDCTKEINERISGTGSVQPILKAPTVTQSNVYVT